MSTKGWVIFVGGLTLLVLVALGVARWSAPGPAAPVDPAAGPAEPPPAETAHITATLFFGSEDGQALVPMRRDVPLAKDIIEQGRLILTAQITEPAPSPYVTVIPADTKLRAFYVTDRGDAFVDLSPEVVSSHPGGSLNELLTVYAVVNAITANLPAVKRVQILVDGREVDTIAGHVDVRRPLTRETSLVRDATAP